MFWNACLIEITFTQAMCQCKQSVLKTIFSSLTLLFQASRNIEFLYQCRWMNQVELRKKLILFHKVGKGILPSHHSLDLTQNVLMHLQAEIRKSQGQFKKSWRIFFYSGSMRDQQSYHPYGIGLACWKPLRRYCATANVTGILLEVFRMFWQHPM